jgi:plasmid stabilization system protein ParE
MGSDKSYIIDVSERAAENFDDIQIYTLHTFGARQFHKYTTMIENAIEKIAIDPYLLGHTRKDLPSDYLAHNVGQHAIVYRIDGDIVNILGILHGGMNFEEQLN